MDFMNTNQSAHGDREYGFIGARMGIARKVVVGYWEDSEVRGRIGGWMNTAAAFNESQTLKVARFGDNMRSVAVTEGDKVEAQIKLGWTVDGYGVGDLVERVDAVTEAQIDDLMAEYAKAYDFAQGGDQDGPVRESIRYQARIELGMKAFLEEGGYTAFITTFEDLHGLKQLPGLAVQRLMEQGYGFAGEGDWKTAALVRLMKIIAAATKAPPSWKITHITLIRPMSWCLDRTCWRSARPLLSTSRSLKCTHSVSAAKRIRPAWSSTDVPVQR